MLRDKTAGVIASMAKKLKKAIPPEGEQQYIDFGMPPKPVAKKVQTEGVDKTLKDKLSKFDTNPFPRGKWKAKDEPQKRTKKLTLADESLKKITGTDNYGD